MSQLRPRTLVLRPEPLPSVKKASAVPFETPTMQSHQMSAAYIQDAGRVRCGPGVEDAAPGGGSRATRENVKNNSPGERG